LNVAVSHPPVVTVVMPAYNSSPYVAAALASVQQQTFTDWETIVVDDCSTDDTRDVVAAIAAEDSRIRLHPLSHNHGAPAAPRNRAVAIARGRFVALLDADDIWHPQKLQLQLAALERTGMRLCSAGLIDFRDGDQPAFTPASDPPLKRISFWSTLRNTKTPTSTILAERQLFVDHPFNEDLAYKAREDLDCFLHMHEEVGASIKVMHPLLGYRITGSQQISGNKATMIRRHYHVLSNYEFASGRRLGPAAALFTATHFGSALYHRALRGRM